MPPAPLRLLAIPLLCVTLGAGGLAACNEEAATPPGADVASVGSAASSSQGGGGAGGGFDASGGFSPSGGVLPEVVISENPASKDEFETSLARTPSGLLAASWTEEATNGPFPIGYAFSSNEGATWTSPAKIFAPIGSGADSVVGADADSNVYLVFLGHAAGSSGVFASRAAAPGTVLGAPVEITDPSANGSYDKPWIVRLQSGAVLVTYQEEATDGTLAGVAATTTDGATWTRTDIVRDTQFRNLFYPCVSAATGRVWVVYYTLGRIAMRHSDDGGATWSATDDYVSAPEETTVAFAEPECAAFGDAVWIAYGLSHDPDADVTGKDPKLYAIRLAHATGDAGVDMRGDAHDPNAGAFFMKPQIAVDDTGYPELTYYAGDAESDAMGSFRARMPPCVPPANLHAPVVFEPSRASVQWMGDYSGLVVAGEDLFASFIDNASGAAHVAFVRTTISHPPCGGP